ncbi:uncharacterized protein BDR25DRAFT_116125 [Lindgomyces ingoldianus]|uniref:Uncharacterized protein n=1 Tax=Lindgomyces ingoldianus TaxID=673940 RepID=A0ACB6QAQ5_9PLEO|nr:uncharacterized protein BDR25DRAFT_116125 [Lindgomyces ingoldianus]KAF2463207.1 hypothetical protein BDR25DRAFT_116125 [Lindgomyces ingoldianus]
MAPTPVDGSPSPAKPSSTGTPQEGSWGKASIVALSIFGFFVIAFGIMLIAFWLHKRAERKKLPPSHRVSSYHPFRTNSQKSGLLANAAPTPEADDKSSMFSRDRNSSVSLYVDSNVDNRRMSMETLSLVPVVVTPVDEAHDGTDMAGSNGSGVSRSSRSSRYSATTGGSIGLRNFPVPEEQSETDLGVRTSRPRSTSTASTRYYDNNSPVEPMPQIPKIVHTPSP